MSSEKQRAALQDLQKQQAIIQDLQKQLALSKDLERQHRLFIKLQELSRLKENQNIQALERYHIMAENILKKAESARNTASEPFNLLKEKIVFFQQELSQKIASLSPQQSSEHPLIQGVNHIKDAAKTAEQRAQQALIGAKAKREEALEQGTEPEATDIELEDIELDEYNSELEQELQELKRQLSSDSHEVIVDPAEQLIAKAQQTLQAEPKEEAPRLATVHQASLPVPRPDSMTAESTDRRNFAQRIAAYIKANQAEYTFNYKELNHQQQSKQLLISSHGQQQAALTVTPEEVIGHTTEDFKHMFAIAAQSPKEYYYFDGSHQELERMIDAFKQQHEELLKASKPDVMLQLTDMLYKRCRLRATGESEYVSLDAFTKPQESVANRLGR